MAVAPQVTYPGVYVQEVPSDVRTITPVATSNTAFIGRAARGPVGEPRTCFTLADYVATFGDVVDSLPLSRAVSDFLANGGGNAVVVRVYAPTPAAPPPDTDRDATPAGRALPTESGAPGMSTVPATSGTSGTSAVPATSGTSAVPATSGTSTAPAKPAEPAKPAKPAESAGRAAGTAYVTLGEKAAGLVLAASSPGSWGNNLRFRISTPPDSKVLVQVAQAQGGVEKDQLFDLSIHDVGSKVTETFSNLTVAAGSRRIADVLAHDSTLAVAFPGTERPPAHGHTDKSDWWNDEPETDGQRADAAKTDAPQSDEQKTDGQSADAANADAPQSDEQKADEKKAVAQQPWSQAADGDDGGQLSDSDVEGGIAALDRADLINLMVIPPYVPEPGGPTGFKDVSPAVWGKAVEYCQQRRAMLLVDAPQVWNVGSAAEQTISDVVTPSENAAIYFPWLVQRDTPRPGAQRRYPPAASVAGVIARTDATRGVWKAPAGLDARVDAHQPLVGMRDPENGEFNQKGINCLRTMPAAGTVVWGARTTVGDDRLANQWKYLPVRRMALFLEESLYRGSQWAVFEPNDEPLWASLRLNIGSFMADLFRQGAFEGRTAGDAYFVHCGATTTTQSDIDRGIVNIVVGFAPLKPAEFVVLYLQQSAGAQSA